MKTCFSGRVTSKQAGEQARAELTGRKRLDEVIIGGEDAAQVVDGLAGAGQNNAGLARERILSRLAARSKAIAMPWGHRHDGGQRLYLVQSHQQLGMIAETHHRWPRPQDER